MGEAVQHLFAFADPLHGKAVVFLVQEESGLLTIYHIDHIVHTIFRDLYIGIKFFSDKLFDFRKTFFGTFIGIAALIDTADRDVICGKNFF